MIESVPQYLITVFSKNKKSSTFDTLVLVSSSMINLYCATTTKSLVILLNVVLHPINSYPSLVGSLGASTDEFFLTSCSFKTFPSKSTKVTLNRVSCTSPQEHMPST